MNESVNESMQKSPDVLRSNTLFAEAYNTDFFCSGCLFNQIIYFAGRKTLASIGYYDRPWNLSI